MLEGIKYSACIRTLGTAGEKYQTLLCSLQKQSIPPEKIVVYIAEGYAIPKETIGTEEYVFVPKGMVAQRALPYKEVETEWMLLLDDDVYLTEDFVQKTFNQLEREHADVLSPDTFTHAGDSNRKKMLFALSGRMKERKDDGKWAYKIMRTAGFSYNGNPTKDVYLSQTNAGPCLLCRKKDVLDAHLEKELWMDKHMKYALGDDQILFYKMFLQGKKILTSFNSGAVHLDASTARLSSEKENETIYSDFLFRTVFWKRFIWDTEKTFFGKVADAVCIFYSFSVLILASILKGRFDIVRVKFMGISKGCEIIKNREWE